MTDEMMFLLLDMTGKYTDSSGVSGYVSHYVLNGKLVIRFEDEVTHEVTVRKWKLVPVDDPA